MTTEKTAGKTCCAGGKCGGLACPITGFRFGFNKKVFLGMIVTIVTFLGMDYLFHGILLLDRYLETALLWRTQEEMQAMSGYMMGGQVLLALVAAYLYGFGHKGKGIREGLRFGIILTLFMAGPLLIMYATQPIPTDILHMWLAADAAKFILAGILLSFIYGKGCCDK